ncbi:MAG: glycosyl transferase, partial [Acidimicrobiales bacterium]
MAGILVALQAGVAAVWAAAASIVAFPYLGVNGDEAVYLLQADSLRAGRLFPPAPLDPEVGRSMLPWLTAQRGEEYVPKYSPAWAGVLALARELTGSYQVALAFVAA